MAPEPGFDPYASLQVVPTAEIEVIQSAYRALAMKYHPDRDPSRRAAQRMADINRAYTMLRDQSTRTAYDRTRRTVVSGVAVRASMSPSSPVQGTPAGSVLAFGRYTGWGLRDVARHDPDYILWLSRHSSGIRYRTEIYGILRMMGVSAA